MAVLIRRTRPFYVHIASLFFLLFIVLGVLQVVLGFRQIFLASYAYRLERQAHHSREVESIVQRQVHSVNQSLQLFAHTAIVRAGSVEERMQALPAFVEALNHQPALAALYVGFDQGDFFLVRRLGESKPKSYLVQNTSWTADGRKGREFVVDSTLLIVEERALQNFPEDFRRQAWYNNAQASSGLALQRPYVLHSTQEPGTTLSLAANAGVVLGADLGTRQLSALLSQMASASQSEMVLCDDQGQVIAASRNGLSSPANSAKLARLRSLDVAAFSLLQDSLPALQLVPGARHELTVRRFGIASSSVLVTALPSGTGPKIYLAQLQPTNVIRLAALSEALSGLVPALLAMLFLFPCVWFVAKRTTNPLLLLKKEMDAIRHFNFSDRTPPHSYIQEINDLIETMASMKQTIREFMTLGKALAAEHRFEPLMTAILQEALKVAGAQGGIMYLRDTSALQKPFEAVRAFWQREEFKGLPAIHTQEHMLRAATQGLRQCDVLDEATWQRDFAPLSPFCADSLVIAEPLFDCRHEVIGILTVILPRADKTEINSRIALVEALAGSAAVSIETQQLIAAQKKLLASLIELLASAIDAKSPYIGGHCQRVPVLTQMLAKAACAQREGPLAGFSLNDEEWEALHIASWLHDCGKITTPEYVVDKATRLETLYNRIHEVRMRFEVLKRDAQITAQNAHLSSAQRESVNAAIQPIWKQLDEEFAFVAACNQGECTMDDDRRAHLRQIAQRQWERTLDDRLGLSHEELGRKVRTAAPSLPCLEPLLADRPEHLLERPDSERQDSRNPWNFKLQETPYLYNRGELYNLSIAHGTLTEEERYKINQHITQTIVMLDRLPFPRHLRGVPEIAGGHHEKMDGSGYPRHLDRNQLSIPARMVAIADIFEALTARDRPYKNGKTINEALCIMADMARNQHIDKYLFSLLVESGIWQEYATRYLSPEQLDAVDQAALLAAAGLFSGNKDFNFSNMPLYTVNQVPESFFNGKTG